MTGKDKEPKEFFEVFKKSHEQKEVKYHSNIIQKKLSNPSVFPTVNVKKYNRKPETISKEQNGKPLDWIKDTRTEDTITEDAGIEDVIQPDKKNNRKLFLNEVVLKQETLIFGAIGAVFLSLACFFAGYMLGKNRVTNPEILQESTETYNTSAEIKTLPPGKKIGTVDLSKETPKVVVKKGNTKWTLQIISYSNTKQHLKSATNLAKAIKNMTGHNTFVAKRGNELIVCAGKFGSSDNPDIKKTLKEIRNLEYEGKKQFASSYPIQLR